MHRRLLSAAVRDPRKVLRTVAVGAAGVAILAAVVWLSSDGSHEAEHAPRSGEATAADPLRQTLLRCGGMGSEALDDSNCRAAWAENRRRFFGGDRQTANAVNHDPNLSSDTETP